MAQDLARQVDSSHVGDYDLASTSNAQAGSTEVLQEFAPIDGWECSGDSDGRHGSRKGRSPRTPVPGSGLLVNSPRGWWWADHIRGRSSPPWSLAADAGLNGRDH
jgi:hypothetical protein